MVNYNFCEEITEEVKFGVPRTWDTVVRVLESNQIHGARNIMHDFDSRRNTGFFSLFSLLHPRGILNIASKVLALFQFL